MQKDTDTFFFAVEFASSRVLIIGGESTKIESYPYQISIQQEVNGVYYHGCGGSIISDNYVLTAAHCLKSFQPQDLKVRAGASFYKEGGSLHQVESFVLHRDYDASGAPVHDIAVIRVEPPFKFDETRQPIELFGADDVAKSGAPGIVTGWGLMSPNALEFPDQLQVVTVPIISKDICNGIYKEKLGGLRKGQICTGLLGVGGKNPCTGDSGGPLAVNGKLAGIVSWSEKCADPLYPSAYTEVAYYRDWIRHHTNI